MGRENMEGSSALIYNVEKFNINKAVTLPMQSDMAHESKATGTLKNSYTTITKKSEDKKQDAYTVEQYTPTIMEPIRFLLEGLQNYDHGYQRQFKFDIIHRKSDAKLFIFANNLNSHLLFTRLKDLTRSGKIKISANEFDFSKIRTIPEIKNIWGVWEKVDIAHITTNASFGNDVDKSPQVKLINATAINLRMDIDGKIYTITLSKDARISSKTVIPHAELMRIFDKYFASILK